MNFIVLLVLLFCQNNNPGFQNNAVAEVNPDSVLVSIYNKLNSVNNIRYDSRRELNYSSENYLNISNWVVYCDFQTKDTIAGFRYQIEDSTLKQVFNGTEKFDLDKKNKTIQINDRPGRNSINSLSGLYNSLVTLKNILPLIIGDKAAIKSISDTTINNNLYGLVTLNIGKRRIQNLGKDFDQMTTNSNFIYKIIADKNNYLPVEIVQCNDVNNDFIKTSFSNIKTDADAPSEISWYYSTYINEFKPAAGVPAHRLLSNGSLSPEWKLAVYNKDKMVSLSSLKGKVILLDFWIKNCGPCIQSVPHLNQLQNKFRGKNFEIVSINSYDSKDEVTWFCNKHKIEYPVLLNGKQMAKEFGVDGFPAFFIIDKAGKIIYSNTGFSESIQTEVEKAIKNAL